MVDPGLAGAAAGVGAHAVLENGDLVGRFFDAFATPNSALRSPSRTRDQFFIICARKRVDMRLISSSRLAPRGLLLLSSRLGWHQRWMIRSTCFGSATNSARISWLALSFTVDRGCTSWGTESRPCPSALSGDEELAERQDRPDEEIATLVELSMVGQRYQATGDIRIDSSRTSDLPDKLPNVHI
jgi:hypothetical protein